MKKNISSLVKLNTEEKEIFYRLLAFTDSFSVDWFVGRECFLPSRLFSVVSMLQKNCWINKMQDPAEGFYEWTMSVPRKEIIKSIPFERMQIYYREAIDICMEKQSRNNETILKLANLCLTAGISEKDLSLIFQAACIEENNHKISSAIIFYDQLLDYFESFINHNPEEQSADILTMFIRTVERRASLSPFYPNLKKLQPNLTTALSIAHRIGDMTTKASLELLMAQNYWISFQYEQATVHFDNAWKLIKQINNDDLTRRGLQSQGLSFWIHGNFSKAIKCYERSIGMVDSLVADDFSMFASLQLALCYTQVGMPQRGLGLSESVYRHAEKTSNHPLAALALSHTGFIFLEMKEIKNSRTYFEMATDISRKEAIPMVEVFAGLGLCVIECLQGNFETAAQLFKVIYKIRKSNWYQIININVIQVYEIALLYNKVFIPELTSVIQYMNKMKKEQLNPILYGIIKRSKINNQFQESRDPITLREKVNQLAELEKYVKQIGETFELAKIRVELARVHLQLNDWPQAKKYARQAWTFLKPIAKSAFPADLTGLIPDEDLSAENRLFDVVIEMSEILKNQKNVNELLTGIITSITRLSGAERAALFILEKESQALRMVVSRNLSQEQIMDPQFREPMDIMNSTTVSNEGNIVHYKTNHEAVIGYRHVIISPLQLGMKTFGYLYQDSRSFSFDMDSNYIKLLTALAPQIALAIDRTQLLQENARLSEKLNHVNDTYQEEDINTHPFGEIIGHHPSMLKLYRVIRKVAPTQLTATIYGETGVGKELVARAIHRESSRNKGPFIRVNCAALPESLIDSELFGHDKGAFTGAIKTKAGRFELANKGTIFLDEISELPFLTQSKILRVIQEKEFQRVGGTETLYSDFRLIAATNRDLKKEIEVGNFRSDLFYRLTVAPITVIPVRERKSDIPLLVVHFAKLYCDKYSRKYEGISEVEMNKFINYAWPGNVRELSNMIEQSVMLNGSKIVFQETQNIDLIAGGKGIKYIKLEDVERKHIIDILNITNGKVGGKDGASSLLGLNRCTLIHRMKRLNITIGKAGRGSH